MPRDLDYAAAILRERVNDPSTIRLRCFKIHFG
jgi:hypothetical protein